jgi:hypothetical protein
MRQPCKLWRQNGQSVPYELDIGIGKISTIEKIDDMFLAILPTDKGNYRLAGDNLVKLQIRVEDKLLDVYNRQKEFFQSFV